MEIMGNNIGRAVKNMGKVPYCLAKGFECSRIIQVPDMMGKDPLVFFPKADGILLGCTQGENILPECMG
jgi:hypothetical protein